MFNSGVCVCVCVCACVCVCVCVVHMDAHGYGLSLCMYVYMHAICQHTSLSMVVSDVEYKIFCMLRITIIAHLFYQDTIIIMTIIYEY